MVVYALVHACDSSFQHTAEYTVHCAIAALTCHVRGVNTTCMLPRYHTSTGEGTAEDSATQPAPASTKHALAAMLTL